MINEIQLREELTTEASRIEEDVLHSAKGHFIAAECWDKIHLYIGIPATIFAALSGISVLSKSDKLSIFAGILALVVGALTAIITFLNPQDRAKEHHRAGAEYNTLKNQARIFRNIESRAEHDAPALTKMVKELDTRRNHLNENSRQIPNWAYKKAKIALMNGEADYKADNK